MKHTTLFRLQCSQLGLLIALSQGTKRWGERTVIMRKGQLTSVGGEIMPKNPPASRVLTPEQWIKFTQGDIKNFRDIDRRRDKTPIYMAALSSLTSIFSGIQQIDVAQGGKVTEIVQSVFQDKNTDQITDNIVKTTPIKNKSFVQGILDSISNAKSGFESLLQSADEEIDKNISNYNIEGYILGGLIITGVALMGAVDLAVFSAVVPAISTKILFSLTKIPIGMFIGKCWQYLHKIGSKYEYPISDEDRRKIATSLPKEIQEEIFNQIDDNQIKTYTRKIINHTLSASKLVAPDKESFKLLTERLASQKKREFMDDGSEDRIYTETGRITYTSLDLPDKESIEKWIEDGALMPILSQNIEKSFVNEKYTLERRLIELNDIITEIENEEKLIESIQGENILHRSQDYISHKEILQNLEKSYAWHKGIIEAELKYGSILDKLADVEDPEEKARIMEELVSKLKSGKDTGSNSITKPDDLDDLFLYKKRINAVADSLEEVSQMSAVKPDIKLDYIGPRGYNRRLRDGSNFINVGDMQEPDFLAYHEFGHALEDKIGISSATENYVDSRSYSQNTVEMKTILPTNYGYGEVTKVSDFAEPYTSKQYKFGSMVLGSEVVSMALQNLINPDALTTKIKQDRDHLLYGLWALDYKPEN
jgi:hypothetical protein